MEILGIGIIELMVIVAVAIIVLGPARAADMAKGAGRMMREVKRSFSDLSATVNETRWDGSTGRRSRDDTSDSEKDNRASH